MAELGAGGGSDYPGALDTDAVLEVDDVTVARADVPNDLADAIIKLETELGIDVAGSMTDLKTRLAVALEDTGELKKIDRATVLEIEPTAAVVALLIDQNNDEIGINIDSEATTAGKYALGIAGKFGLYISQDVSNGYGAYITRTIAEAGSSPLVTLADDDAANTQNTLFIDTNGNAISVNIDSEATSADIINIDAVMTSGSVIDINMTGAGNAVAIDINNAANHANDVYAIKIICDNAGAGDPGGIDLSNFAAGEPLLHLPVDANAEGAYYGRFAVYVVGVGTKYVSLYEA